MLALGAPAFAVGHKLELAAGGEVWPNIGESGVGGHGFAILHYQLGGLPRGGRFDLYFNSDTLRLAYEGVQLAGGKIEIGGELRGEALIAGVLSDYYRDGKIDPAREFWASYASASAWVKLLRSPHFVELAATARKWFFNRQGMTAPAFVLPPEAWVGEIRMRYTLWWVDPDPSLWEAHRLFPRVRGFAFGVEVGLDARSDAQPWGARAGSFAPPDYRNDPQAAIFQVRQWLRAGVRVHRRVRLQFAESAVWMWGEDDLVRMRVGGMNPYVVPLAGAPWASLLVGRVAAAEASMHVRVWREMECGVLADVVAVDDVHRSTPALPALLGGFGAFADFRHRAWQADLRLGWSPNFPGTGTTGAFAVLAALGWSWAR